MREVVIVEGVRTAVGKRNGALAGIRPDDLAGDLLKGLMEKAGVSPGLVEDVIMGCVTQSGEQAGDIARVATLIAGFPVEVPGVTIDRQCGSSQQAVHFASQAILSGDMDIVIAGGVESMSRTPIGSNFAGAGLSENLKNQHEMIHQGISAERIADTYGLSRDELDRFALASHKKALQARANGYFKEEIHAIKLSEGEFLEDEGPRAGTSLEALGSLRPVFREEGIITAGNSSQISDGAAALLLMSRERAVSLGLKPRFKVHTRVVVGSDPTLMLTGPIPATKKVLEKSGIPLSEIDVFEVNEAFAPVVLAWQHEIGADPGKVNPNGGAIALGHPLGASGARIMVGMMHELERTGGHYGLQTMCEGHGMANATIIERI
ncbi:thiolase family protein [Rossellomorea marisflavi]|uniref:thiolase family protein n=1 Tax=Rossellomorea marisflavi TaxID=189381 RepID=UPI0028531489|nr:thiolase family protein [Rossellomorea marisflavi]MDR4937428.1 thiolase family protein [Rossellomorea marisflavi]